MRLPAVDAVQASDDALVVVAILVVVEHDLAVDDAHLPVRDDLFDIVVDRQERLIHVEDDRLGLLPLGGVELLDVLPPQFGDAVAS